ncbi:MAG TPA: hypothetical protein VE574_00110 [Nitrososphaeraceae archaeon]|jgi:hypothetical protein|nr:hypothetical protein [Nitrososphaeraceae archaeon]
MDSTLQAAQDEVFYVGPALGVVVGSLFLSFILAGLWVRISKRKQRFDPDRVREKYEHGKEDTTSEQYRRESELNAIAMSALLGVSIIAIIQLLQTSPDNFLLVSTYAFAIAIPVLSAHLALYRDVTRHKYDVEWGHDWVMWTGMIAATTGVVSLFWHFSYIAGVLFLIASGIAYGWFFEWQTIVEILNQRNNDDSEKAEAEKE